MAKRRQTKRRSRRRLTKRRATRRSQKGGSVPSDRFPRGSIVSVRLDDESPFVSMMLEDAEKDFIAAAV
jgi:hypothetical protein